jgi:hypothetical protein
MARYIEIKGSAKTYVGIAVVVLALWSMLGKPFFSFNLGVFNRGYQVSLFRGGHFEKQGLYWQQHEAKLGRIVTFGGTTLAVDLTADIEKGTLVLYAWRWPGFLFAEPVIHRSRFDGDTRERLEIALPGPGLYVLSASALWLRGDISVDWRVAAGD